MPDYQKMYYTLFNEITKAIEMLQQAQQRTEEIYIDTSADNVAVLRDVSNDHKNPG